KQIALQADLPPQIFIKADAQMLALIIRNLLTNAIKFTRKGGNIQVTAIAQNDHCILMVKDDGVGIPEELQLRLFRIDSGSRRGTESEKGTGLGLMLCREFTDMMDGELSFTSSPGKGTAFSLKLPLAENTMHGRTDSGIRQGMLELFH